MSETNGEAPGERPAAESEPREPGELEAGAEEDDEAAPESSPIPKIRPTPRDEGFQPRHPDALRLELAVGGAVFGALSFAALLFAALLIVLGPLPGWGLLVALAVPALLFFPLIVYPRWRHQRYRYRAGERGLELRKGVWWRSHRFIPRTRLQHTDIAQGPLERKLGLASLVVHTAGTHEARTTVTGLSLETATELRDRLTGDTDEAGVDGV